MSTKKDSLVVSSGIAKTGVNEISRIKNFKQISKVSFPEFSGLNINMMPILVGDVNSLPEKAKKYIALVEACNLPELLNGKIAYITITESIVKQDQTQRKRGIHLDFGKGGFVNEKKEGEGIYIANNVEKSCRIWDTLIESSDVMDDGSCEHYRTSLSLVGEQFLEPSTIYLIHENCPHESMAMPQDTKRQFFRLVVGEIKEWYEEFSTPNSLGIKPDCKIVPDFSLSDGCHGACW